MKKPPADLATRLLDASEHVLHSDPPPRLEDVARLVGASRATMYYYFSGRDDLLAFLLTAHAEHGAQAVRDAVDPADPLPQRLRAMLRAMAGYLGHRPGICAGMLGALGAGVRMSQVLAANDTWIAGPLRALLTEGRGNGALAVDDVTDTANTIIGGLLLAVLGRSITGADTADPAFHQAITEQIVGGLLSH